MMLTNWIEPDLIVNAGHLPDTDVGPVISPQAKDKINRLIQSGIDEGASCILDGRNVVVPGYEKGNFIGPTILSNVTVPALSYSFPSSSSSSSLPPSLP